MNVSSLVHVATYVVSSLPQDQDTALTIASYHGKIQVVKELLAAGALTDIQDNVCHMYSV